MDIEQYLADRKRHFDTGTSRIRNFEVFDFNYTHREWEFGVTL